MGDNPYIGKVSFVLYFIKSIHIPKIALKSCNNYHWPIVPPVSEVALLVAGDGTSAQEVFRERPKRPMTPMSKD